MDVDADRNLGERNPSEIVETARSMLAEQFQIAERLDRKARYQVATSGAFFAVVQALAVNAIVNGQLSSNWATGIAALAAVAGLLAVGGLIATSHAWRTVEERDLPLADLRDLTDRIQRGDEFAVRDLAHHYLNLVEERREQNADRERDVGRAVGAVQLALVISGIELVSIFVALS